MLASSNRRTRDATGQAAVARLKRAQALCASRGERLTALRGAVLRLMYEEERPLGAYEIIELLGRTLRRDVSPITVYRVLDFLLAQRLVSRLASRSAFAACSQPELPHTCVLFVCVACGGTFETRAPELDRSIVAAARALDFQSRSRVLEVDGVCRKCGAKRNRNAQPLRGHHA